MARHQANSVLYPVVKPVYETVKTGKRFFSEKYGKFMDELDIKVTWQQIGSAIDVEDAKEQGFVAPILDLDYYQLNPNGKLFPNYI